MPSHVRYHAQRKHIVHSLDSLLYQLHTLSFLLAPSLLIFLSRCATQFQFARARELDGRRSLAFWFFLVALVNAGGVWAHAATGGEGGGGAGGGPGARAVVLDFVGMGHTPSKLQLLLLDATIIFLQALLTTIAYETSLALALPADVPDPLLPASPSPLPSPGADADADADSDSESAPFLSASPPLSSPSTAYPPAPLRKAALRAFSSSARLPPAVPVVDLTLRHVAHRLTAPAPELPERTGAGGRGDGGGVGDLDYDRFSALHLPLPNTMAPVALSRMVAHARRRQRERQEAWRTRWGESRRRSESNVGRNGNVDDDDDDAEGADRGSRSRAGRVPGAIDEAAEDSD
ncbi:hypothetical protein M0805_008366 [Coniferiporia weirii]|nr:hypothetical protein M0805_008366 [Coniferiporia weirii]